MRAAVVSEPGGPFAARDDVERRAPGAHDVVVRIRAAGLCQTDISLSKGAFGQPLPAVLGHEGAGEIIEVGGSVRGVAVGDHVLVNWVPPCGHCYSCLRGQPNICRTRKSARDSAGGDGLRCSDGSLVVGMGTATFAEETVLAENAVIALDADVPFPVAALMGCAVPTGMGAALHAGHVEPGDTVLVVGAGAIGLSAVQGARIAGAGLVAAVDPEPARRTIAERLGAHLTLDPEEIAAGTPSAVDPGGFDVGIDAVGRPETIRAVWDRVRRGGTVVVVGAGGESEMAFTAHELFHDEKTLRGCFFGSGDQRRELPRMTDLWRAGQLRIEEMIELTVDLDGLAEAVRRQAAGEILRTVVLP